MLLSCAWTLPAKRWAQDYRVSPPGRRRTRHTQDGARGVDGRVGRAGRGRRSSAPGP